MDGLREAGSNHAKRKKRESWLNRIMDLCALFDRVMIMMTGFRNIFPALQLIGKVCKQIRSGNAAPILYLPWITGTTWKQWHKFSTGIYVSGL